MIDVAQPVSLAKRAEPNTAKRLQRRYAAERRFRIYGAVAVVFALAALVLLLGTMVARGSGAFVEQAIRLEVFLDPAVLTARRSSSTASGSAWTVLRPPAVYGPGVHNVCI